MSDAVKAPKTRIERNGLLYYLTRTQLEAAHECPECRLQGCISGMSMRGVFKVVWEKVTHGKLVVECAMCQCQFVVGPKK